MFVAFGVECRDDGDGFRSCAIHSSIQKLIAEHQGDRGINNGKESHIYEDQIHISEVRSD